MMTEKISTHTSPSYGSPFRHNFFVYEAADGTKYYAEGMPNFGDLEPHLPKYNLVEDHTE